MNLRPRVIVHGIADPGQAVEAAELGVDAIVVAVGEGAGAGAGAGAWPGAGPQRVDPERAAAIARAVPPLVVRLAWCEAGLALPPGYHGAVVGCDDDPVPGAVSHVLRVTRDDPPSGDARVDANAVWIAPASAAGRGGSPGVLDFALIERWARRRHVMLEVADGASGVEVAMRLARPYAIVLGEGVWFQPGIVDMEKLESAMAVISRVSRALSLH